MLFCCPAPSGPPPPATPPPSPGPPPPGPPPAPLLLIFFALLVPLLPISHPSVLSCPRGFFHCLLPGALLLACFLFYPRVFFPLPTSRCTSFSLFFALSCSFSFPFSSLPACPPPPRAGSTALSSYVSFACFGFPASSLKLRRFAVLLPLPPPRAGSTAFSSYVSFACFGFPASSLKLRRFAVLLPRAFRPPPPPRDPSSLPRPPSPAPPRPPFSSFFFALLVPLLPISHPSVLSCPRVFFPLLTSRCTSFGLFFVLSCSFSFPFSSLPACPPRAGSTAPSSYASVACLFSSAFLLFGFPAASLKLRRFAVLLLQLLLTCCLPILFFLSLSSRRDFS